MSSFDATNVGSSAIVTASKIPLIVSIVLLVSSALLYVFRFELANNWFYVIGYLATPFGTTVALAWDINWQRKGQQTNSNFDVRPQYTKVIRVLAVVGFVVGIFHIIELGTLLGQWVVQQGFGQ